MHADTANHTFVSSNHRRKAYPITMLTKPKELNRATGTDYSWNELGQQWVEFQAVRKNAGIRNMCTFASYLQTNHINAYANLSSAVISAVDAEYETAAESAYKTGKA